MNVVNLTAPSCLSNAPVYADRVKFRFIWRQFARLSFQALGVLPLLFLAVEAGDIRLRNETVATTAAPTRTMLAPTTGGIGAQTANGLILIQFSAPPDLKEREALARQGIKLIRYIADNAWIARSSTGVSSAARPISSVSWLGEFRPDWKIHRAVAERVSKAVATPMPVTVLLASDASPEEIQSVRKALDRVEQESALKSGQVLRGTIQPGQIANLAQSTTVLWIEPGPNIKLFDEVASKLVAGDGGPGRLLTESLGYNGAGVTVAVADSGLNNGDALTMHPDLFGRTPAFFAYGGLLDAADEHSHGTHVAGIVAGNGATGEVDDNGALYGLGVAPGASIIAQRIFDGSGGYFPPPSFERMTRDAVRAGADIGSNSWGDDTQGRYDVSAMEFDELVRDADALKLGDQPYILEFSAGNAGPGSQTIGSPAVAKNVLATGASENDRPDFLSYADGPEAMADFSSRGPCEDGRIKPDVVAPGTWISSLQSASATDQYAWAPISPNYQYQGGTSQAGPHASGAAAVFVQWYRQNHNGQTPSPALVKAALINTAADLLDEFGTGPVPNMDEGWGRIDLVALLDPALKIAFLDQTQPLTNGQVYEQQIVVNSASQPLKITLTYSDAPGFPGAIPALVNDLDLEVIDPVGTIYRGNQFFEGESIANAAQPDTINNVEAVHLFTPIPGRYFVRVRGTRVVEDVVSQTFAIDQDFALVVSADLATAGTGVIGMDRTKYRQGAPIRIQLVDSDLAGKNSATVSISSTTETTPEPITLKPDGVSGVFTGMVRTATGTPLPDGQLQLSHGDQIDARYFDQSAGVWRTATAQADFLPPVISAVTVTNQYGQAILQWTTDEPANSVVRFGTNTDRLSWTRAVTNIALETSHSLALDGLTQNQTYYLYFCSADEAGNTSTNDNAGNLFSVFIRVVPPVLLVDSFPDDPTTLGAPPISGYTDALQQAGAVYDFWNAVSNGPPTEGLLRSYRAVIWRVPELVGVWSPGERTSISNYLAGGGSLFVASMEVLSRLEESGGAAFIHDVLQVQSYVVDPQSTGASAIQGLPLDPISAGLDLTMDYAEYETLWLGLLGPDLSDTIVPGIHATGVFKNQAGDTVGLRTPAPGQTSTGRLVFFSFPFDAVPTADRGPLMTKILAYLAPGSRGSTDLLLDSPAYTLPSRAGIQLGDSGRAGQGSVSVTAGTDTQPGPIQLSLFETARRGVFAGTVDLIAATNAPQSGKLRAVHGDTLTLQYVDSSGAHATATAAVDTQPPTITLVGSEPDYVSAIISWDTSEPTDALVQFGESALLNRTAYAGDLSFNHDVSIPFLTPDRLYYYQVVSRDAAGNTTTDDNHGKLYTFRTLRPIIAPWADNLDSGATNWTTYTDPASYVPGVTPEWTLGVPNNQLANKAHSPPNAWGSNLKGAAIDFAESYLISPAIYLTNGNVATLHFWHCYDFTDLSGYDVEFGQVMVVSENQAIPIAEFGDSAFDWIEEEVDLTPYAGKLVYLVWYYVMISVDAAPRPGWLVDDVSITMATLVPGTILITNNLWQAHYFLSGAAHLKGTGKSAVLSNTPPGNYIMEYADLPYYRAPAAVTNYLAPGGTITFTGNYTFPDTNNNGISDEWELAYFGVVSSNRTARTDSDGDGMSDLAEFIAGTDPMSPRLAFKLTASFPNPQSIQLEWPSTVGVLYRVQATTNSFTWQNATPWIEATSTVTRVNLSNPPPARWFRAQMHTPTNTPGPLPANLSVQIQPASSNRAQLVWTPVSGRAYQLLSSTNGIDWIPASDWLRPKLPPASLLLPTNQANGPSMFRLQVQP